MKRCVGFASCLTQAQMVLALQPAPQYGIEEGCFDKKTRGTLMPPGTLETCRRDLYADDLGVCLCKHKIRHRCFRSLYPHSEIIILRDLIRFLRI